MPEFHECASLFPLMSDSELQPIIDDMHMRGYDPSFPIILHDGLILDGRNRYRAAQQAGVEPLYSSFSGKDPLEFVIRSNLNRRHLSETQRAVIAETLANMPVGRNWNSNSANLPNNYYVPSGSGFVNRATGERLNQTKASALLNVSPRLIRTVKAIKRDAPELVERMRVGEITAHEATAIINDQKRADKLKTISANNAPLKAGRKRYSVICADPPWRYEFSETKNRQVENQYPTMSLEEIRAFPIDTVASPDCILFLWATSPKLAEALSVIEAWGFIYRTCMVWVKDKIGMGYYARQQHELILIATRGKIPAPEPAHRPSSVVQAPRGEHSEKPQELYDLIEAMYPNLDRLEMFARGKRKNWDVWGNQA